MNSQTSIFNKTLYKKDLRLIWILGIIVTALLFLDLPMSHIRYLNEIKELDPSMPHFVDEMKWSQYIITNTVHRQSPLQIFLLFSIPIVAAGYLLGEERRNKTMDLLGVMPYSRVQIYTSKVLAGLTTMIIPYVINFFITMLMRSSIEEVAHLYNYGDLLNWLFMSLVIMFLLFSFSIMMSMLVGTTIAQMILTIIFMSLPAGMFGLIMMNMSAIEEITSIHFNATLLEQIGDKILFVTLPAYILFEDIFSQYMNHKNIIIGIVVIVSIIMIFIGNKLFLKNKMERNGEILMFGGLETFFKIGVTICSMLLFGPMIVFTFQLESIVFLIVGYAIGLGLGWFIPNYFIQVNRRA